MTPPDTLSKRRVVDFLKQARVKTEGMNDNLFLYSVGRNGLIDYMLVAVMCGDFAEEDGK